MVQPNSLRLQRKPLRATSLIYESVIQISYYNEPLILD